MVTCALHCCHCLGYLPAVVVKSLSTLNSLKRDREFKRLEALSGLLCTHHQLYAVWTIIQVHKLIRKYVNFTSYDVISYMMKFYIHLTLDLINYILFHFWCNSDRCGSSTKFTIHYTLSACLHVPIKYYLCIQCNTCYSEQWYIHYFLVMYWTNDCLLCLGKEEWWVYWKCLDLLVMVGSSTVASSILQMW